MNLQELITALSLLISSISGLIATIQHKKRKQRDAVIAMASRRYDLSGILEGMLADGKLDEHEYKLLNQLLSYGQDEAEGAGGAPPAGN